MLNKDESQINIIPSGKVFVFEGIDNVGKSTIVAELGKRLEEMKITYSIYSFPGKISRTLGALVYELHHNQNAYFDKSVDDLSLQMLHVAAHIDTINNKIIPDLKEGKVVLLDRFWWSTYVYGIANGIKKSLIKDILLPEKKMLEKTVIEQYFLVKRRNSDSDYDSSYSETVLKTYEELGVDVHKKGLLTIVDNNFNIEVVVDDILNKILDGLNCKTNPINQSNIDDNSEYKELYKNIDFIIRPQKLQTTPVYDAYWKFAVERQNVFFNRLNGTKSPWTEDTILQKYKFTNAYRASDRVSQYLIKEIIYNTSKYSPEDTFFRVILFKLFNKIETWEYLRKELGEISYKNYSFEKYDQVLLGALEDGKTIYSAAYIMPSGQSTFGFMRKHQNNLKLIEKMMNERLPSKIASLKSMEQLYNLLLSYPTLGKFLAFQYCIDINYTELCDFSEMSFVVAGPGAINGIKKCFHNTFGYTDEDIIKFVAESQDDEFNRLDLDFKMLWGRPLQLIDCQNLFCETGKYARVAFPEIQGTTDRKRIKQLFTSHSDIDYFYPPKWNINQFIKRR